MTQPAQPAQPTPQQPSIEERIQFQQKVTKVAEAVTMVVRNVDPILTVYALTSVIVTAVQATPIPREDLIELIAQAYDRTRQAMAMLGVAPGQPPPADFQQRVEKMMADALAAQGG
jgi:hypothetical protein